MTLRATLTYAGYQQYMAYWGFPAAPLSCEEWQRVKHLGDDAVYGLSCDVAAGVPFETTLEIYEQKEASE